jgi:hypothetical protein
MRNLRKNTWVMPVPKLSSQHAAEKPHQVQPKTACCTSGGVEQDTEVWCFLRTCTASASKNKGKRQGLSGMCQATTKAFGTRNFSNL